MDAASHGSDMGSNGGMGLEAAMRLGMGAEGKRWMGGACSAQLDLSVQACWPQEKAGGRKERNGVRIGVKC